MKNPSDLISHLVGINQAAEQRDSIYRLKWGSENGAYTVDAYRGDTCFTRIGSGSEEHCIARAKVWHWRGEYDASQRECRSLRNENDVLKQKLLDAISSMVESSK